MPRLINRSTTYTCLPLLLSLCQPALAMKDPTATGYTRYRDDIDYATRRYGLGGSVITDTGKFDCLLEKRTGETRIDSFNEIFGLESVKNARWLDYSGNRVKCSYGLAFDLAGGKLTAGVGFDQLHAKTELIPGGKKNDIDGMGLKIGYKNKHQKHDLTITKNKLVGFSRHETAYANYDDTTTLEFIQLDYTGMINPVYLSIHYTNGEKTNFYTTPLLPVNTFNYGLTQIAAGPLLNMSGKASLYIAPILTTGSDWGSFNALDSQTEISGLKTGYQGNQYSITFVANRFEGTGRRPYPPATDELFENKETSYYFIHADFFSWNIEIGNSRYTHLGSVAVTGPVYIAILGGSGPFINQRNENKWQGSVGYQFDNNLSLDVELYYTQRKDKQYSFPVHKYSEKGAQISMLVRF